MEALYIISSSRMTFMGFTGPLVCILTRLRELAAQTIKREERRGEQRDRRKLSHIKCFFNSD